LRELLYVVIAGVEGTYYNSLQIETYLSVFLNSQVPFVTDVSETTVAIEPTLPVLLTEVEAQATLWGISFLAQDTFKRGVVDALDPIAGVETLPPSAVLIDRYESVNLREAALVVHFRVNTESHDGALPAVATALTSSFFSQLLRVTLNLNEGLHVSGVSMVVMTPTYTRLEPQHLGRVSNIDSLRITFSTQITLHPSYAGRSSVPFLVNSVQTHSQPAVVGNGTVLTLSVADDVFEVDTQYSIQLPNDMVVTNHSSPVFAILPQAGDWIFTVSKTRRNEVNEASEANMAVVGAVAGGVSGVVLLGLAGGAYFFRHKRMAAVNGPPIRPVLPPPDTVPPHLSDPTRMPSIPAYPGQPVQYPAPACGLYGEAPNPYPMSFDYQADPPPADVETADIGWSQNRPPSPPSWQPAPTAPPAL